MHLHNVHSIIYIHKKKPKTDTYSIFSQFAPSVESDQPGPRPV